MKTYLLAFLFSLFALNAYAMRCGNKVILPGETVTPFYVQKYCGKPDAVSTRKEQTSIGDETIMTDKNGQLIRNAATKSEEDTIDTWQYAHQFGQLAKILTFKNGVLIKIEEGERVE